MAESRKDNSLDGTPVSRSSQSDLDLDLHSHQEPEFISPAHEDEMKDLDSRDDYSSGSDRSIEIDDLDDGRGDSGSGGGNNDEFANCSGGRHKKRHGSHGSRRHRPKGGIRHKLRSSHFLPYPGKDDVGRPYTLKRKSLDLQAKENAAAVLRREENQEQPVTFPVAPFNSTQFLMDEHDHSSIVSSPLKLDKLKNSSSSLDASTISSVLSTPEYDSSNVPFTNMFQKDKEFSDIYSTIHAENLQNMSKDELVKHYMSLEEQVASLQKQVAEVQQQKCDSVGKLKLNPDKDKDLTVGSETNSLPSANEEFVDQISINQPVFSSGIQHNQQ